MGARRLMLNALQVKARLGYETVEATLMVCLIEWVLLMMGVLFGHLALDMETPRWYGTFFWASLSVLGAVALIANFLNRAHFRADATGVTFGIRPVPVNGFPFRRHIPVQSIAGIYVGQCDLWVRFRRSLIRTYELHALTKDGESVRLLQRIADEAEARDLAVQVRKQLGVLPKEVPSLRERKRSASEKSTQFAGFIPVWAVYGTMVMIGAEFFVLPLLSIWQCQRISAVVVRRGGLHNGRRSCTVKFSVDSNPEPILAEVQNGCARDGKVGDQFEAWYDSQTRKVRKPTYQFWPIGFAFGLFGVLGLIFSRERIQRRNGAHLLWEDRFRILSSYWHLDRGREALVKNGVLTVLGRPTSRVIPNTEWAFDPGTIEVRVQGEGTVGIAFGLSYDGIGYLFEIHPRKQTAAARRIGNNWAYDVVREVLAPAIDIGADAWNTLRVSIKGTQAELLVNGSSVGSFAYENTMGGGMVGLYVDSRSECKFSELVVLA